MDRRLHEITNHPNWGPLFFLSLYKTDSGVMTVSVEKDRRLDCQHAPRALRPPQEGGGRNGTRGAEVNGGHGSMSCMHEENKYETSSFP